MFYGFASFLYNLKQSYIKKKTKKYDFYFNDKQKELKALFKQYENDKISLARMSVILDRRITGLKFFKLFLFDGYKRNFIEFSKNGINILKNSDNFDYENEIINLLLKEKLLEDKDEYFYYLSNKNFSK